MTLVDVMWVSAGAAVTIAGSALVARWAWNEWKEDLTRIERAASDPRGRETADPRAGRGDARPDDSPTRDD